MSNLVEKVARAIEDNRTPRGEIPWSSEAKAAIAVVLKDQMAYAKVAQVLNVQRFIEMIARENGVSLVE